MKRIIPIIVFVAIVCIFCSLVHAGSADNAGPSFGKWSFTGKDNNSVSWTGTLVIDKLDTNRFDASRFYAMCSLGMQSAHAGKGIETPCTWDPRTRAVSFSTKDTASYTAILSPDSKSMTRGTWTDSEKDSRPAR